VHEDKVMAPRASVSARQGVGKAHILNAGARPRRAMRRATTGTGGIVVSAAIVGMAIVGAAGASC
jgi:hypothetical protein